MVNGRVRESGVEVCSLNVYVPCNLRDKMLLWERVELVVGQNENMCLCVIGDFNSILESRERARVGSNGSNRDMREFWGFVERSGLMDMGLIGQKFTCFQSGDRCNSRLDRALVNEKWAEKWPDTELKGLPRSVSDHCALVLSTRREDWGPKPF